MHFTQFIRISVMIPTRGRAETAHRSLLSLIDSASTNDGIEYVLAIDRDDIETYNYFDQVMLPSFTERNINCRVYTTERFGYKNLQVYVNFLAAQSQGNWLLFWNDDCIMQSQDWDLDIEQYNGQFKLLKFQDNHNHHPFVLFPVIPRAWFELFGQISPHAECDAWLSHVCYAVDCVQQIKTTVCHDRADMTGNNNDQTYQARTTPENFWTESLITQRWQQMHKLSQYLADLGQDTSHWQWLKSNNLLNNMKDLYKKLLENDPNGQIRVVDLQILESEKADRILQQIEQSAQIDQTTHVQCPYVSIVVAGRNDDYGDKFLPTLNRFIKHLDYQLQHHQSNLIELVVVEWNPLPKKPLLHKVLTPAKYFNVRIITVPAEVHNAIPNNPPPVVEFLAKNVGSRRACGQFILATNPDIIFSQPIIDKIAMRQLQHNTVYRVDHYNFDGKDLDTYPVEQWVDHALSRTFDAFLTTDQSWITVKLSESSPKKFDYLPQSNLSKVVDVAGNKMPLPHLNSCGSFMLLSKLSLDRVSGFYESFDRMVDSTDSISMARMLFQGIQQEIWTVPYCLFHKEHNGRDYPWNQDDVFEQAKKPGKKDWGMADHQFEETLLGSSMIELKVDSSYAFDYLSILEVKRQNLIIGAEQQELCKKTIEQQLGFELTKKILSSKQFKQLVAVNQNIFDLLDQYNNQEDCDKSSVLAQSHVANQQRHEIKKQMQKKFFACDLTEKKSKQ